MKPDDFDPTATDAPDAADAGEFALPPDYFELRCLMLDQFVMALTDLKMDVPTAVATSIDALTGRARRSPADAEAVWSVALGLLARHAPDALLPKYAAPAALLRRRKTVFRAHSPADEWFLDDLRWVAQKTEEG